MTTKSDKIRSLFLSALMVMSVFAGTAAMAGSAAATHDGGTELANSSETIVYQGQTAVVADNTYAANAEDITLYDDEGEFINNYDADSDGHVTIPTDNLQGVYYLGGKAESDNDDFNFQVVEQELSVSPDEASATTDGSLDFELNSQNRDDFEINVTADSEDVIQTNSGTGWVESTSGTNAEHSIPLSDDIEPGNYTITVSAEDTTASETIELEVTSADAPTYSLANAFPSDERGDVGAFTVNLENTDSAYVQFGSSDVSYAVGANVTDSDGDGQVTVLVHTYETDNSDAGEVLTIANSDDDISDQGYIQDTGNLSNGSVIEAGDYGITVYNSDPANESGEEQTFGTFILNERSTDDAQTWISPVSSFGDASEVRNAVAEGDSVAKGETSSDTVVVEVSASGLYDYFASADDLGENGLSVDITQTNPKANAQPNTIDNYDVVTDPANNTFYLVVDVSDSDVAAGQNYEATFTVDENNYLIPSEDATESVSTEFSVVERTVSFDTNDGDTYRVAQGEQEVTGTSTLAPGSEFTVTARSSAANLLQTQTVTVQDDGTWSADFDFSDVDDGTEFTFTNKATDDEASAVVDADFEGGEDPTTTTPEDPDTTTTTTETTTTTTTTETTTETDTTTTTEETTEPQDGGIPGFGVSVALVAIIAAALLALRRSN